MESQDNLRKILLILSLHNELSGEEQKKLLKSLEQTLGIDTSIEGLMSLLDSTSIPTSTTESKSKKKTSAKSSKSIREEEYMSQIPDPEPIPPQQKKHPDWIHIYVDGACSGVSGGWGLIAYMPDGKTIKRGGSVKNTTNNRCELQGAIEGVKLLKELKLEIPSYIYSDSRYVVDGISGWIYSWQRNNWKNDTVKNRDLWEELIEHTYKSNVHRLRFEWVKAHVGIEGNEQADQIATHNAFTQKPKENNPFREKLITA